MLNYKLLTVLAFILITPILFDNAFAARAGSEFSSPTQQNAHASYDIAENDVQVSWNFSTLPADTVCMLKGDFVYYTNLNTGHTVSSTNNADPNHADYQTYTKITSFIPLYYSVVSSNPTTVVAGSTSGEVIPCEDGSIRIDLDIIMSHSKNVNNYEDLEIFLSFYVANADGSLNLADASRIDEVFVLFTPNNTFDNAAQQYGCGDQIGSVLYIDQSAERIHGNNGDNCIGGEFEYVALNSNQWINIGMDDSPGLALGVELKGDHDAGVYSLLILVVEEEIIIKKGGSDDDHNSRPTFGMDHKRFTQLVDEGLVVNGQIIPVLNNFHTQMDIIELKVGDIQNFTSTVFAPHTLKTLEFVFGVPELGEWHEREASVEIETNYDGEALDFKINDDDDSPIINATSLVYSSSKVKCNATDNTDACYRVTIELSFLQAPIGKVLALQAIDNSRKNEITYFNDGIDFTGDSLNAPTVQHIISEIKYKGLQTIQLIDKENDIWMTLDKSEPVLTYQQNDHGSFNPIEYRVFEKTADKITTNMHRLHSEFSKLITNEQNRALLTFDSRLLVSELGPSSSYDYPTSDRMAEIMDTIKAETKRTQEVYENSYPDYEKTKSNH